MVTIRKTVVSHFNPRSPHGERRTGDTQVKARFGISIHAPRTGSDTIRKTVVSRIVISIHAPRTGSDRLSSGRTTTPLYFNPRSPHGERLLRLYRRRHSALFQSTLPARGATLRLLPALLDGVLFQSTLPARGATWRRAFGRFAPCDFNPRSPHGERQDLPLFGIQNRAHFNPRSPHGERRA